MVPLTKKVVSWREKKKKKGYQNVRLLKLLLLIFGEKLVNP
jgi:hypothetical protein